MADGDRPLGCRLLEQSVADRVAHDCRSSRAEVSMRAAFIRERARRRRRVPRTELDIDATAWRLVNARSRPPAGDHRRSLRGRVRDLLRRADAVAGCRPPARLCWWSRSSSCSASRDSRAQRSEGSSARGPRLPGRGSATARSPNAWRCVRAPSPLSVDLRQGQKTGAFLDQRENHQAAGRYARGRVLDAFTYNGGFALQMAARADSVLALDSSAPAVAATLENARRNALCECRGARGERVR